MRWISKDDGTNLLGEPQTRTAVRIFAHLYSLNLVLRGHEFQMDQNGMLESQIHLPYARCQPPRHTMHPIKKILAVCFFLAMLLVIFQVSGLRAHFDLAFLRQRIIENRVSGLIIFILLFSLGNLIQIPGWVFLAAAVLTLGKTWGAVATYAAASFSCIMTFLIIRFIGGNALRQIKNKLAIRLLDKLEAHPIWIVVLLRTFFQTVPALNYALAVSGIKFREYLIGTLVGLPAPIAVYCVFFEYLAKVFKIT
jgi:uncharacterized membrane protein YdjX (TVP38/TMEM64 family)